MLRNFIFIYFFMIKKRAIRLKTGPDRNQRPEMHEHCIAKPNVRLKTAKKILQEFRWCMTSMRQIRMEGTSKQICKGQTNRYSLSESYQISIFEKKWAIPSINIY